MYLALPFTSSLSFDGSAGCFNGSNSGAADFGMWAIGGVDRTYAMWFKSTAGGNCSATASNQ